MKIETTKKIRKVFFEDEEIELKSTGTQVSGTKNINKNGVHDVSEYANADVNIQPMLQDKSVNPTTQKQIIQADEQFDGLGEVVITAVNPSDYYKPEEVANVTPTTSGQKITPSSNAVFKEINVSAVTSAIDTNLKPDIIKKGEVVLGLTGTYEGEATGGGGTGSPKFAELVDGSIVAVEESDLADVQLIRANAFRDITNLQSVAVPSNIQTIGVSAFEGCSSLTTLSLAEGVEVIGASAFSGTGLTQLNFPSSIDVISENAFANTPLTEITMVGTTPPTISENSLPVSVVAIHVPSGTYYAYVESWSYYADKIVTDFDLEEVPNETGTTLNIMSNDYREILNEQNGYTLEIGG